MPRQSDMARMQVLYAHLTPEEQWDKVRQEREWRPYLKRLDALEEARMAPINARWLANWKAYWEYYQTYEDFLVPGYY